MMSAVVCEAEFLPPNGEQSVDRLQSDDEHLSELPRIPPKHRHAVPSAPWPWMDLDAGAGKAHLPPGGLGQDSEWSHYPQSLFGTWTHDQVERCGILKFTHGELCSVHKVDVLKDGSFDRSDKDRTVKVEDLGAYWRYLETSLHSDIRVRALFVENMTAPVLQILGTKYNIEPTFFASSVNCIPSRYQQDRKRDEDHITVILPFIRTARTKSQKPTTLTVSSSIRIESPSNQPEAPAKELPLYEDDDEIINTQAPLPLPGNRILFRDLLAIHMYRTSTTSTVISFHPNSELQRASAKRLQSLVRRAEDNARWSKVFRRSNDPTFIFLVILWYAQCTWDETFAALDHYINCLESDVSEGNEAQLSRKFHRLQTHILYYQQLLEEFRLSVEFVRDTPNPAINVVTSTEEERTDSVQLLRKEADSLIFEIERLRGQSKIVFDRVQNDIHLAAATVNIESSNTTHDLATSKILRSARMKQVAYLAMVFLPGTFLANVFRMKIREFQPGATETLAHYVEAAIGLALSVWWLAIALQPESAFYPRSSGALRRALWPLFYVYGMISTATERWYEGPKDGFVPQIPIPQAVLYFFLERTRKERDSM